MKLSNLIWEHIYFQNDIVSVPSKVVIKLFIFSSCCVLNCKALCSCLYWGAI